MTEHNFFNVANKSKFLGSSNPIYRSSWEKRIMTFCDINERVKRWGYEYVTIPYYGGDGKQHRYIIDFYIEILDNSNKLRKCLVEVKPMKDSVKPKPPKVNNRKAMFRYIYELNTFKKNTNKWNAARMFCESKNLEFHVLTEATIKRFGAL